MTEYQIYHIIVYGFLAIAVLVFISLFFVTAPYGRHARKGWGFTINSRAAWMIQEAPASLLMFFYFFYDSRPATVALVVLLVIWQIHYFHRSFIYPFTIRTQNRTPFSMVLSAIFFNVVNTYVQGCWLFHLSPETAYTAAWLKDPRFIIGAVIFTLGFIINKHSDYILRNLRKPGETEYKIPQGGIFRYVTGANYLGEIITWTGWAIATWSVAGLFFLVWTIANLAPRARSHHQWYKEKFSDYPAERKVLIPFIY